MSSEPNVVLEGYTFLEGPRWHEGRIWVSDFYTGQVVSARADGSDVRVEAEVPNQPSGLGWLPDGRLLVVSMKDRRILRREADGSLVVHADLAEYCGGHLNDMLVDPQGRAYAGNFGFDLMAGADPELADLVRVDPDGTVTVAARDLWFPNGMVLLGDTLVVNETMGNRISAFDVAEDGSLGPRRDFAVFDELPPAGTDLQTLLSHTKVGPDGAAGDSEGGVWFADAFGQRAARVLDGKIVDTVDVGTGVYACALGGEDGRTLFLCTAPSFAEHERKAAREAQLLSVTVSVPA
ncbi:Sugar lactone lactonase YvrE [Pseudonocardia thermophila]|jgi:Gluconolactonase|uniref:Sugar lactone lactonase YvrE n=1 Tax=Pseudonocardia thermophila TaxID=1848 RepID=A0A1M6Z204_PSETH|nr:SMP-30/gluconolactonase/LRE family protein [Pseudonocardia thermophila]SHL24402.1 Sugar lactone lactonase YvrE [Pseudonocardia thermophila]